MAMRRHAGVRCGMVANDLPAFALFVAASFAACDDRGTAAQARGRPTAARGRRPGRRRRWRLQRPDDLVQPVGAAAACAWSAIRSPASSRPAARHRWRRRDTERGVCCLTAGPVHVHAVHVPLGSGVVVLPVRLGGRAGRRDAGDLVAECPAPTAGQKCCFSQDNATCICSGLACAAEETQVANCSATAAGACRCRGGYRRMPMNQRVVRVCVAGRSQSPRSRRATETKRPLRRRNHRRRQRRAAAVAAAAAAPAAEDQAPDGGVTTENVIVAPGEWSENRLYKFRFERIAACGAAAQALGPAQPTAAGGGSPLRGESSWVGRSSGYRRRSRRSSCRRAIWSCAAAASS